MRASSDYDSDIPVFLQDLMRWTWGHREQLVVPVAGGGIVLLVGVLLYLLFTPSDLERAEADIQRAGETVLRIEAEAHSNLKEAKAAGEQAKLARQEIDRNRTIDDVEWLRWKQAIADGWHVRQVERTRRRDALLTLVTEYTPLVTEARREILRAQTARDQGHSVRVAPRVRDILAPVLAHR